MLGLFQLLHLSVKYDYLEVEAIETNWIFLTGHRQGVEQDQVYNMNEKEGKRDNWQMNDVRIIAGGYIAFTFGLSK